VPSIISPAEACGDAIPTHQCTPARSTAQEKPKRARFGIRAPLCLLGWTPRLSLRWGDCSPKCNQILAGSPLPLGRFLRLWGLRNSRQSSSETGLPLPTCQRSPLQRPHGFDRVGCRIAHSADNRLIVEALDVLESEFASGNVGADLLDHAVMIDQRFG
jgi:hypothetical protein